jgi:nitroreductase
MTSSVVDAAISSGMLVRAFTQEAIGRAAIADILRMASRAPSGTNCLPWKVYVLQGASAKLSDAPFKTMCGHEQYLAYLHQVSDIAPATP